MLNLNVFTSRRKELMEEVVEEQGVMVHDN